MATVTSLTETRISELLSGWTGVVLSQENINSLITQLGVLVEGQGSSLEYFNEVIRPQLEASLSGQAIDLANLQTNVVPDIQVKLDAAAATIETLIGSTIPTLQDDLVANQEVVLASPHRYVQAEEPTNPDEDDRDLVVGDTWYNPDLDNEQKVWNGAAWSTLDVGVPDLSEVIPQYLSPGHAIYPASVSGSQPVVNGANITPSP